YILERVTWNVLVAGYAPNGLSAAALEMVARMQEEGGERPDSIRESSGTPREAHAFVLRAELGDLVNVATAILDAYCKCSAVEAARAVFDWTPVRNAMIDGYVQNGDAAEALALFKRMVEEGVDVTDASVLAALQACGELGYLDEAERVHELLVTVGLEPNVSVMNTLITTYSKCKKPDLAAQVFDELGNRKTQILWNAMILGFTQNGCPEDAVAVELFEEMKGVGSLPNETTFLSVLVACSHAGLFEEGREYFASMKEDYGLEPGTEHYGAMVDLLGRAGKLEEAWLLLFIFANLVQNTVQQYARLAKLIHEIKAVGYVPDTDSIHDVEDDVKAQLLNTHSEKLAIAYGIIRTAPGTTIKIKKNLRVCNDCHNVTKLISLVTGREIIMRHIPHFRHFKDGKCSCGDYW
ncbi:hypothetical protein U9M48_030111, partial [Paspalum notatum var. saurae]